MARKFFKELSNINVHEEAFSGSPAGICTFLDNALLKDTTVIQLLTKLPRNSFCSCSFISTGVSGPRRKHLNSLKSRVNLPNRARTGINLKS